MFPVNQAMILSAATGNCENFFSNELGWTKEAKEMTARNGGQVFSSPATGMGSHYS